MPTGAARIPSAARRRKPDPPRLYRTKRDPFPTMMKEDNRNLLLAIVMSVVVLLGWQFFYGVPQMEKQKQIAQQNQHRTLRKQIGQSQGERPRFHLPSGLMRTPRLRHF